MDAQEAEKREGEMLKEYDLEDYLRELLTKAREYVTANPCSNFDDCNKMWWAAERRQYQFFRFLMTIKLGNKRKLGILSN